MYSILNVAELKSKDRDFWESLRGWDVIVLTETWVEKKGGDKIRERLPGGCRRQKEEARNEERKGK